MFSRIGRVGKSCKVKGQVSRRVNKWDPMMDCIDGSLTTSFNSQRFQCIVKIDAVRKALPKMAADPNSVVITDGKGQYSVQSDTHHPSHPAQPSLNEIP